MTIASDRATPAGPLDPVHVLVLPAPWQPVTWLARARHILGSLLLAVGLIWLIGLIPVALSYALEWVR